MEKSLEKQLFTGIECLRAVAVNFCRDVNFAALLTQQLFELCRTSEQDGILELARTLELAPELCVEPDFPAAVGDYRGPLLILLKNDNWVCVINTDELKSNAEDVLICDPLATGKKFISVQYDKLTGNYGGKVVKFKHLLTGQESGNTALFCLTAIGRHHGLDINVRRLLHEYAVDTKEIPEPLIFKIARDYGMKTRKQHLDWERLALLGEAFPVIAEKQDGSYVIICGWRKINDDEQIAVIDPSMPMKPGESFIFWNHQKYTEMCNGKILLIKRIYSLLDEKQPFGMMWFVPEFIKLKGIFGQIALAVVLMSGVALITPLFFQIVVDKVLVHASYTTLNVLGIGIIIALCFNAFIEFLRGYLLLHATNKIDIRTATKTFEHLMQLPVNFYETISAGVLIKHMQQTEKIRGFLSGNLFFTILELGSLVVFVPFLLIYSVKLTIIVLGFSMLMAGIIALMIKPFQTRLQELYQAEGKRQGMLVEAIHGIKTIKSLALEPVQKKKWNDSTAYAITRYFRVGKISLTARSISQLLEALMSVTIIWVGALSVFEKEITVGSLIAFQMLSGRVTGPLVKLISLIHEYQQTALSVKMLGQVMNTPAEPGGGGVQNPLRGNISFDNVSFQYTPDGRQVIKELSCEFPSGSVIGIVGRSGSGKTTLTKLLQSLYQIQSGIIRFDGIDLKEINKAHLRSSIGVVLQDNFFFHGTVRENISITKRNATLEEIIYAAKLAGAEEFIQEMPRGYDSILEENASNLSGGQRQRLAIARALLTNPTILVFDEATSALDPESENVIQNNLAAMARGRTLIIVSHRLSIIHGADKILVLDNGVKTAFAPHSELVKQPGIYQEFWQQQMGRFL